MADVRQQVIDAANQYGLDPNLLVRQFQQESGLNQNVTSKAGAMGVTQLMPGTAAQLGVNPRNTAENIDGGARYMRQMVDRYPGDYPAALGAYNCGPGCMDSHLAGKRQLPAETQNYVTSIMGAGHAPGQAGQAPQAPGNPGGAPSGPPSGLTRVVGGGPTPGAPAPVAAPEPDTTAEDLSALAKIFALTQPGNNPAQATFSLGSALARALAAQ
jgi:Transglycosylase SLT domain